MRFAYMKFYPADYLADTQHLTTAQHGAYVLLLLSCWARHGVLDDNDAELAKITKTTSATWKKMRVTMQQFFTIEGGYWRHKRVTEELENALRISTVRSRVGKAGGKASFRRRVKQKPSNC